MHVFHKTLLHFMLLNKQRIRCLAGRPPQWRTDEQNYLPPCMNRQPAFGRSRLEQVKTFNESCVMVRQPSLELISYLKRADYSKPALCYILYGLNGTGKTMSLCHTLHYCYTQGRLNLHIPDAHLWVKNCKELLPSSSRPSRFDQPIQASQWLKNFKVTNECFLTKGLI
ncbi:28S ribosomal protein S29, mitochondrial-like [Myxocyprinus asiaticus]|uniref:28S ribosomal protein S29, mitochondrial-like n=1 Tax=Myxocyprinus asiaticus TaxID=70543 RepID=UPI002223B4D6|nr:28S ribosomal protein S29, mitochondrial-like [Myxocyprinus asiaticus]